MLNFDRAKKGINAYVKNDAKASAIASFITNKDCTQENLLNIVTDPIDLLSVLPLLSESDNPNHLSLKNTISKMLLENTSGKILYLLCGPSTAGKDTLASYVRNSLYYDRVNYSYVSKYTTRQRRGFEGLNSSGSHSEPSGNYEYFKDKAEMYREKDDVVLPYTIYDHYYGISGDHLASLDNHDKNLMAIYGRFEDIHDIKREIFYKYKRIPFAILITAPSDDLENRILRRHSMTENEQVSRIKEMKKQIRFIESNDDLISTGFDLKIVNSDSSTITSGCNQMAKFIKHSISFANQTLH